VVKITDHSVFWLSDKTLLDTKTAMRSCWDPETAVIHFWSPGGVRHRPQPAASGAAASTAVVAAGDVCGQGGSL